MFENSQHAQSPGLLPSGRPNFSLKSARIPAKKLLASGQNSSPLVILLFFKQGLESAPIYRGTSSRGPAPVHNGVGATLVVAPTGVGRWTVNVPMGGKRGCPGTSAPTKKGAANRRIAAGTALKMKVKYKYIARLFDKSLRASACSPPRPLPPLTAHRSTVPIHP